MPGSGRCKPTLRDFRHERSRFASARGAVSAATFPARGSGDARSQTDRRDHVQRLGFDWPAHVAAACAGLMRKSQLEMGAKSAGRARGR